MAKTKTPYQAAPAKTRRAVDAYYKTLKEFDFQGAIHEGAVSTAFQTLLTEVGRKYKWTLIPQLGDKQDGRHIRPDGTMKDQMLLVRGHWEAKDTNDDLDVEIKAKIANNYPLGNIIFEDTQRGVLIQNGNEALRTDLTDPDQLVRLLEAFFKYVEPQIDSFEKAIDEFKERVPELATALKAKIEDAHESNKPFKEAFAAFFQLCQVSLNPNIAKHAIDDMLVQHLLTERLIRKVFDNPEFTRRNVIAVEIEKVISALTSKSFNRAEFLQSLDRFYIAIEDAARTITDWSDKQHFLNTVYERFFQGYSVKLADTMGIVYTPQPIVDFMCASVAKVLETEFGKKLGSKGVNILDPCTGTGNFIVNLMKRIPKRDLPRFYREQLFANEVVLMAYYIATLNIEHTYYEETGKYEEFDGMCFVDTLDLIHGEGEQRLIFSEANAERIEREENAQITVVIGNPPYNASQVNENDNNKNRKYKVVDSRVRSTYVRATTATKTKCYDPYVRFFRWATDRLGGQDGIVCYITNNSFVHQTACDGLRALLPRDFDAVYHFDLRGNVRKNPTLSGTAYNVFGIQVGVGITIAVRGVNRKGVFYARLPLELTREGKLERIAEYQTLDRIEWTNVPLGANGMWHVDEAESDFDALIPMATKAARGSSDLNPQGVLFKAYALGVSTNRDAIVYDFHATKLLERVESFARAYNGEVDRYRREEPDRSELDDWVDYTQIKWSRNLKRELRNGVYIEYDASYVESALYRPFVRRVLYNEPAAVDEQGPMPSWFLGDGSNRVIGCSGIGHFKPFSVLVFDTISSLDLIEKTQCFPFYIYDEDGSNRRENITDWALKEFRSHYKNNRITKWDIFHYVYGVLHHPGYREKYVDNLKRDLPHIPYAPDFRAFARAGKKLAKLHLDYAELEHWALKWIEAEGVPLSYRVEKMRLNKDKTSVKVNDSLTLGDIPPEVFEYRLGNRSALDWVIDQYRIKTDKRSGIESDPNREDDPEYIVRLIGQVVRVSIETVKIVSGLPAKFSF